MEPVTSMTSNSPAHNEQKPGSPVSLYELSPEKLRQQLKDWGEPTFHCEQIWRWVFGRHAQRIDDMSDLSKSLRTRLNNTYTLGRMTAVAETQSTDGWTRKWLLRMPDGSEVETVLMEYEGARRTACISTQAGCGIGCSFCATGQMGFVRNLSVGEILEQVIWVARVLDGQTDTNDRPTISANDTAIQHNNGLLASTRLTNIVFMGMGEPFANYRNLMEATHRLVEPDEKGGFGLGARKITVSTVGLVPGIHRFAGEDLQLNLAVSLHAATDELRNTLVPINKRYPLRDLSHAVHDVIKKTNRRVSIEWALIDGVNDTAEQAAALVQFVLNTYNWKEEHRHMLHVNLIPLNPTAGYSGRVSSRMHIQRFRDVLDHAGIPQTLRVRRGVDIRAGCGQLKAEAGALPRREGMPL